MDQYNIKFMAHKMINEKGIDKVDLSMLDEDTRKIIYESYGDKFSSFLGPSFLSITLKAYGKAKNLDKIKQKLDEEANYAVKEEIFGYALLCYKLLNNEAMIKFLENNYKDKGKDLETSDEKLYEDLVNIIKI